MKDETTLMSNQRSKTTERPSSSVLLDTFDAITKCAHMQLDHSKWTVLLKEQTKLQTLCLIDQHTV
jgi:hypothetical protein